MSTLIELRGVSKRYYRKRKLDFHALRHVNLKIEKGDVYGIIGFSGAGKSTLLRCLSTLEAPTFGQVIIDGENTSDLEAAALLTIRREMGMVFQHFNLFSSRTVKENILYPLEVASIEKEEKQRRVHELLALVGLKELQDVYPSQLSGGQKQRVGIARALANNPKILLCDEATSALDPQATREILLLIQDLQKKLDLTVVVITHEMEVIKAICNKVAVLEHGEVVESGTLAEVFVEPKHPVTKKLVLKSLPELPTHLLSGKGKVFHLHFKGTKADQPVITKMVKQYDVEANILLGWIDSLQTVTIGNLIVEVSGSAIEQAIRFLRSQDVIVEEMQSNGKP